MERQGGVGRGGKIKTMGACGCPAWPPHCGLCSRKGRGVMKADRCLELVAPRSAALVRWAPHAGDEVQARGHPSCDGVTGN